MAIYLKYEGITGDATEESHVNWIQCNWMGFGASRPALAGTGAGSQRQGGTVAIGEFHVRKRFDAASPHLFLASVCGFGKKVTLHVTRTGEASGVNYLEVVLDKTCVTSYELQTDGKDHWEKLSLNFLTIEMKYLPVNVDNKPGQPIPVGFDVATGVARAAG
jgi:type VI secretion system secreted protein Hcp